ncbi:MAG: septum formation initiator family protein [Duncaniella sp.]|nr:septum formation initiator family protein [Duncaniella sp.]MDE5918439.1 septum formation initiator family protein [Duncaniella sp.]MDE6170660.1 septum formation initiator family protein [Duncaniella sp.]
MKEFFKWCRRYLSFTLLAALGVGALVLFFNENSLLTSIEQERRIEDLKARISEATDSLVYYRDLNRSLNTDKETMERIVREQHHMQHPDEDVYIFE